MVVEPFEHTDETAAVKARLVGIGATVTVIFCMVVQPKPSVTKTEYVPLFIELALDVTVGFSSVDVNPLGPDHEYVKGLAPPIAFALSTNGSF